MLYYQDCCISYGPSYLPVQFPIVMTVNNRPIPTCNCIVPAMNIGTSSRRRNLITVIPRTKQFSICLVEFWGHSQDATPAGIASIHLRLTEI